MNFRAIIYILGWISNVEGILMLLPFICGLIYGESDAAAFLVVMIICLVVGIPLVLKRPKNMFFFAKDGMLTVALCWIALSVFGCLPFVINGDIPNFVDALFETISGFSTTGASILSDVEKLSHCSLFWRSFTHWIGGMGVLVFLLAFLPLAGGSHMQLMKAESPGPSVTKLVPNVKSTAIILYLIYLGLSVIEFLFLICGGMPLFDSLCTMFGTAGTGGFGIKNDSFASYSPYLQWVVTVFMALFGVNFSVYFLILVKKFKQAFLFEELRWYFGMILVATAVISIQNYSSAVSLSTTIRDAAFQVSSLITTTGFSTTDFNLWCPLSKFILMLMMFSGACAGSTGGGVKVSRLVIMAKTVKKELVLLAHPQGVKKIKFGGKMVDHEVIRSINVFLITYLLLFAASMIIISFDNADFETNFGSVLATMNNIGPGFGKTGPMGNYGFYSPLSKIVLMFDMLAGRLELYPMLMLFYLNIWGSGIKSAIRNRASHK